MRDIMATPTVMARMGTPRTDPMWETVFRNTINQLQMEEDPLCMDRDGWGGSWNSGAYTHEYMVESNRRRALLDSLVTNVLHTRQLIQPAVYDDTLSDTSVYTHVDGGPRTDPDNISIQSDEYDEYEPAAEDVQRLAHHFAQEALAAANSPHILRFRYPVSVNPFEIREEDLDEYGDVRQNPPPRNGASGLFGLIGAGLKSLFGASGKMATSAAQRVNERKKKSKKEM